MDEKNFFQCSVTAYIPAEKVRRLYERLSDEATPHAVRVTKALEGVLKVTIYCQYKNYFSQIITHL